MGTTKNLHLFLLAIIETDQWKNHLNVRVKTSCSQTSDRVEPRKGCTVRLYREEKSK
jgi:hypothetical protein